MINDLAINRPSQLGERISKTMNEKCPLGENYAVTNFE